MTLARLGPAIFIAAFVLAYYFATSWAARRAWRSKRISTRTFALVIASRLHFPLLIACLLSPVLFDVSAAAALTGAVAIAFLLAIRLVVVTRSMPAFEEAVAHPLSTDFAPWSRGEKWVV